MEFQDSLVTAILEAAATAIGVGMVLGGFAAGLVGLLGGVPRDALEFNILKAGYIVAACCLVVRAVDLGTI